MAMATFSTSMEAWKAPRDTMCSCDFCVGKHYTLPLTANGDAQFKLFNGKIIGVGCMNPPSVNNNNLQGLAAWLPPHTGGMLFGIKRSEATTDGPRTSVSSKTGYNCKRCNSKNDYACSNQPDGSYVCFECR